MRASILRWVLPIVVMLLIATVLVLSPLISHASAGQTTTPTTTPVVTPTATPTNQVKPNAYWYW